MTTDSSLTASTSQSHEPRKGSDLTLEEVLALEAT